MKKILCAILCAVLTLTFVACGGNGGNTSGGDDVYVKVIDKGLGSKWIENIASAYYEETGIKVHVSSDPELVSNLLTLMNNPGSEKEDLYFVGHTMNNWIKLLPRDRELLTTISSIWVLITISLISQVMYIQAGDLSIIRPI